MLIHACHNVERMQNDKYIRPNDGVLINHEIGQRAIPV